MTEVSSLHMDVAFSLLIDHVVEIGNRHVTASFLGNRSVIHQKVDGNGSALEVQACVLDGWKETMGHAINSFIHSFIKLTNYGSI